MEVLTDRKRPSVKAYVVPPAPMGRYVTIMYICSQSTVLYTCSSVSHICNIYMHYVHLYMYRAMYMYMHMLCMIHCTCTDDTCRQYTHCVCVCSLRPVLYYPALNWSEIWSARPSNIDNEEWYVHCKYCTVCVLEGGGSSVVVDAIAIYIHVHCTCTC